MRVDKLYGRTVLVTGASSGIGKSIAEFLAGEGYRVYGTSRSAPAEIEESEASVTESAGFLKMVRLDVCSDTSVKEVIRYIKEREGRIDILINNAGFGIAGSVEDTSPQEAYKQMDTNFFGVHRMCREVLPIMRNQRSGLIINIGSVAGLITIPYQSMYSASKYALEAMSEAMRIEVQPFGIKVVLIEPGDTKTGFTGSRQFTADSEYSVYKNRFLKAVGRMMQDEENGPGPEVVVKAVHKALRKKNPPVRITVGFSYKLLVFLKRLVPSRFVLYVLSKMY